MARVNPVLQDEQVQYNPIHRVTGLFDNHDAVTSAVRDLEEAGFPPDAIDRLYDRYQNVYGQNEDDRR